jgi:dTDP-4-dehydrorhamnose reductase
MISEKSLAMAKLLVVGANGLLGQACVRHAVARGWAASGVDVGEIDITDAHSVESVLSAQEPSAVINAAAYTDVEGAETEEGRALANRVNGTGPGILADACARHGSAFIHLSTDYVFNGTARDGVSEAEVPGEAMNAYGETKRAGELAVIDAAGGLRGSDFINENLKFYLVRTSWLFGASAKNFVGKIIERAQTVGSISVVTDEIGSPTYVEELSGVLLDLLEGKTPPGIYHATGAGSCSRFEFAEAVLLGIGIKADLKPSVLADYPRRARIAPVSVLRNTKLPSLKSWQEMVASFAESTKMANESNR